MKKLAGLKKRTSKKQPSSSRITNETVAEHRERILAEGRRFKYPIQYTKNKLVINALVIGLTVVVFFTLFCWWQLYKAQSTDTFFYRLTRVVPLPVATVDGAPVKYGDYMLNYKMSETYLNTVEKANQNQYTDGGASQYDYYKAQAMADAVADTYAHKLASKYNISVTDKDVDDAIARLRKIASSQGEISQEAYDRTQEELYGVSPAENRYLIKERLLRQMVAYAIDDKAKQISDQIEQEVRQSPKKAFDKLVAQTNKKGDAVQVLVSGWVPKTNKDGGLAAAASKLKQGEIAGPLKPAAGDGYYYVKLLDTNANHEINYQFIKVPLTEFSRQLKDLKDQHDIRYFIKVPDTDTQVRTKK